MNILTIHDFLGKSERLPILDVRSPSEFEAGHIPSAVSFPLFTDEERADIGKLYKQVSREAAVERGWEIANPKKEKFLARAAELGSRDLSIHCWRGGMRSEGMARFLEQHGYKCTVLKGGYKTYRRAMLDYFEKPLPLLVLTGYTGSRKTDLLHMLGNKGEQVIDLEGLARHQGSSFGNQKAEGQPTAEQFQNLVFEDFRKLDTKRPIWIEDECMRIGTVHQPEGLYRQINTSPHVFVEIPKEERVRFLVKDYGLLGREKLEQGTIGIRKKLGYDRAGKAIRHIREGDLEQATEIILKYYDRRYRESIERKRRLVALHIRTRMAELEELATKLSGISGQTMMLNDKLQETCEVK